MLLKELKSIPKKNLNTKHDATLLIDRAKNFSVQEISEQYLNFFASKPK